jgi:hypothetical protein
MMHSHGSGGGFSMNEIGKYYKLHYSRVRRIIEVAKSKTAFASEE